MNHHEQHHQNQGQGSLSLQGMNQWALISFALIGFIVGYAANGIVGSANTAPSHAAPKEVAAPAPSAPAPTPPRPAAVPVANAADADDDPFLGEEDAPVTLIEFTDYECPFCGRHKNQTMDQIIKDYVDTGKVKYVVRDYPLSFHQNAQKASEATECADDQGKFWEMHGKLFENQRALTVDQLKQYAKDLGLDSGKFDDCLDSDKYAEEVKKDMADGSAAGITGTPGFFINDKKVSGAQPYASFKAAIDAELQN